MSPFAVKSDRMSKSLQKECARNSAWIFDTRTLYNVYRDPIHLIDAFQSTGRGSSLSHRTD